MALPKEPRQKMINIMYLVLTALLALNVSAEILNAFKVVDNSLKESNNVLNTSTTGIYSNFEELLKDPKTTDKASIWKPKADQVRDLATVLFKELEDYKQALKVESISMLPPANSKRTILMPLHVISIQKAMVRSCMASWKILRKTLGNRS